MSKKDDFKSEENNDLEDEDKIEQGFTQMEMLYRSRCVQAPLGSNVVVREIKKDE